MNRELGWGLNEGLSGGLDGRLDERLDEWLGWCGCKESGWLNKMQL